MSKPKSTPPTSSSSAKALKAKNSRKIISFLLWFSACWFLYADRGGNTEDSLRMPKSHHPSFAIAFELPSSSEEINSLLTSKLTLGPLLRTRLQTSLWFSFRIMLLLFSSLLITHRLLKKKFPRGSPAVKWGMMLSLSFWVLDWQRHALWISLQKSEGGYENKSKEDVFEILLLMLSRSKWIAFHLVVSLLARAYQIYFVPDLPSSIWSLPNYLGSKDMLIPTVFVASSIFGMIGTVVPTFSYFVGLSMDMLRLGAFFTACWAFWTALLPKMFRKAFTIDDGRGEDTAIPKRKLLTKKEAKELKEAKEVKEAKEDRERGEKMEEKATDSKKQK
ncbi:hypothetical protein TrLO_g14509 [Triparma laevis f. longispina]|uniref:Uncharacterized protein n=1 Tax=Triparma laevis f. longispina TaxID=1714387 RepID=A0A9W7E4W6_9STRA|nr:hypothetical protein TrLO_g14509 [Triparma laevis f. longispina]